MKLRVAIKTMKRLGRLDALRDGSPELNIELVRRAQRRLGSERAQQVYDDEAYLTWR